MIAFFEERRGRLHGFRWRDHADWKSGPPGRAPLPADQAIGTGDGTTPVFQLVKTYGHAFAPWTRTITKPVASTVRVAVAGATQLPDTDFSVDTTIGLVTFLAGRIPAAGAAITAGYEFDVPVRFDTDKLDVDVLGLAHGTIPHIPVVEIRLERTP